MNKVLVDNAILGPWIYVGSKMQMLSAPKTGDVITARAKVTGNYDKKGHRFVELDALVVANGKTPLAHCHHIAIYQPREAAAAYPMPVTIDYYAASIRPGPISAAHRSPKSRSAMARPSTSSRPSSARSSNRPAGCRCRSVRRSGRPIA